jgi:WD40 repeat protein
VNTQSASALSLSNSATPLSASLSPDGTLLFVGADDGTLHVIDTTSGTDTQQVTFPFPTNELCFGPGNPLTQVPLSQVRVSAVSQSGSSWAYTYSVISGPALKAGQSITVANMSTGGDNGAFTIIGFGTDSSGNPTFLVTNPNGASASNQSGLGTVPISCNPDLVAVKP